ncbi:TAP-like protein [Georgenia soli]|uniref:TAP-like protein n=1 Tax=Georgenia soli TaxID=638953 RepID=A0A2A9EIV7_9MICO|nr:alpha/beta fold hydrolase [Georgenia soli]PFG38874.1 TAP-like protein [Georgenia soli]
MRKVDDALIAPRRSVAPAGLTSAGRQLAAAVAALLMLVAAAVTATAEPRDADRPPGDRTVRSQAVPSLTWGSCGAGLEAFQCATAEVPSDYDDPAAGTTTIALTRLPATAPSQRIGSLFLNFGGPGGPGVATLHALGGDFLAPSVRARFDVVGFDPRGVGASDPATCFRDAKQESAFLSTLPAFPVTPEEEPGYIASMAALGTSCTVLSADRISVASTANVARDLDLLRAAVGDEKLTYIGYSYGTFLGATYAKLFPDRVRALTLDGTALPEVWVGEGDDRVLTRRLGQHVAGEEVYGEFLRLCKEAGPNGCALAALGDPGDVVESVLARLRTEPAKVPGPDGTTTEFGYDDAVSVLFQTMYDPRFWADVAAAFASLAPQPPTTQSESADPGHHAVGDLLRRLRLIEDYPSVGGAYASLCVDTEDPAGPLGYPAQADEAEREARHFGRMRVWATQPCAFIPVIDEDAYTGPWDQTTDEPVLVIGTRFDPATPYRDTAPYAEHWPDARVLTVEGYGHTTIVPSTCASAAIATYLVDLEARDGAVCRQDVRPFGPAPQDLRSERAVPHLLGMR